MNPLGKEQDKIFEHLEKGNFIVPPGGDPRDQADIPLLKRALLLLIPGLALTVLLPGLLDSMELAAFLGALVVSFGAGRMAGENGWFRATVACAAAQTVVLGFVLVAQTTAVALMTTTVYTVAVYTAMALGALVPAVLTAAVWKSYGVCKLPMALLAVAAVALVVICVVCPAVFAARLAVFCVGAVAIGWLAGIAYKLQ